MAAACLPSKTGALLQRTAPYSQNTHTTSKNHLQSLKHGAQTESVARTQIWGFFQHFKNTLIDVKQ